MRVKVEWTTPLERRRVIDEALALLEGVGMQFGEGDALRLLGQAGATVDAGRGLARLPAGLVMDALRDCPRDIVLGGASPEDDCLLTEGEPHFVNSGSPTSILDHRTGVRRASTLDDLRQGTVVLDAIASTSIMWAIASATDVPPRERLFRELVTMLSWSRKHVQHEVEGRWQVEAFRRVAEAAGGNVATRPRLSIVCCTASPLRAHAELLDASADIAAMGFPVVILPMPIAGATAPITAAGTATMNVAEFLGAATAIRLAAPDAKVIMGIGAANLDMRETTFSFGALETGLAAAMCVEVAHDLGVPCLAPAMATDAKHPGIQAAYEKALKGFTVASARPDLMTGGIGLLQGAGLMSLPQVIIDDEIAQMILRILKGSEVSGETIMPEVMARVGTSGNYLGERETRRRVRSGDLFFPVISDRRSYEQWEAAGGDELDAAAARLDVLLAEGEARGPLLDNEQTQELEACVDDVVRNSPEG
ncbi:MAG TPA: trimethylamine methyltransferase family protein [Thermoleophilia bacterium]